MESLKGRRAPLAVVGALSLSVIAGCGRVEKAPPYAPALENGAVIYGADGREDWYALAEGDLKAQARDTVAAMIPWEYLSSDETGAVVVYGEPTLGESFGLCANQRFRDQPTAANCSGTLIGEDLLLTAGHCVPGQGSCAGSAWVFDYLYEAEGVRAPMNEDSVYRCVDVIVRPEIDLDEDLDLAVIQLDRPVGRTPARVAPDAALAAGAPLILAGFPNGIPLKVDDGGVIFAPRTQQGNYFVASVDAFSGNSGSGVWGDDLALVGVLVSGADDYANAGSCAVVANLDPDDAEEAVMYAHHAASAVCKRGFPSALLCPEAEPGSCGDGFCVGAEQADGCAADCNGLFAVPEAWTCDAGWYDAGDDCDCDCGAFDPDCDDRSLDVLNCAPGSTCKLDGTCREPIPSEWQCWRASYGDGESCNCDCGAIDPDCANANNDETGCAPGGECQADGTCTISLPDGWECRRRFYGSGDGCDCDCGARDPDCDDPRQEVFGCLPGSACLEDGSCEEELPAAWVCDGSVYGVGDDCDCNCGTPDPDCADSGNDVRNCGDGETCREGVCVERAVEPEPDPEAGPEAVEPVAEEGPEEAEVVVAEPEEEVAAEVEADEPDSDDGDAANVAEAEKGAGGKKDDDGCAGGGGETGALLALGAAFIVRLRRRGRACSALR